MSNTAAQHNPHKTAITQGLTDSLAAGFGIFPLGIAFGMLTVQLGLPWWVAPLLSGIVFAGSVEFILITLIAAHASLLTIGLSVFAVNFRHVFYALSFPLKAVKPGVAKLYSVFALTDECYSTYAGKSARSLDSARILTMQITTHLYWIGGGLLGVALALTLPLKLDGFEFALCALFTVLALDAFHERHEISSLILAAISFAIAWTLTPNTVLLTALLIFTALLLIRYRVKPVPQAELESLNTATLNIVTVTPQEDNQ